MNVLCNFTSKKLLNNQTIFSFDNFVMPSDSYAAERVTIVINICRTIIFHQVDAIFVLLIYSFKNHCN
jgi:hypothetical protein